MHVAKLRCRLTLMTLRYLHLDMSKVCGGEGGTNHQLCVCVCVCVCVCGKMGWKEGELKGGETNMVHVHDNTAGHHLLPCPQGIRERERERERGRGSEWVHIPDIPDIPLPTPPTATWNPDTHMQ